jgi:hypothetical protein
MFAMIIVLLILLVGIVAVTTSGTKYNTHSVQSILTNIVCPRLKYQCMVATADIDITPTSNAVINPSLLSNVLNEHDEKGTTFLVVSSKAAIDGSTVDRALMDKPWWTIDNTNNFMASSTSSPTPDSPAYIYIFRRVPTALRSLFSIMANRSYTNPATCAQRPLLISVHEDNTWGNRFYNIATEYFEETYMDCAFTIYIKRRNYGAKSVIYFANGEHECKHTANKWECLFLPLSNCSIPTQFLECTQKECGPEHWTYGIYTNATSSGRYVTDAEKASFVNSLVDTKRLQALNPQAFREVEHTLPKYEFTAMHSNALPEAITEASTVRIKKQMSEIAHSAFFNGFATRFNSEFRGRTHSLEHKFRNSFDPPFEPLTKCVAMHIRMDDRTPPPGTDIIDWCNKCAKFADDGDAAGNPRTRTRVDFESRPGGCDYSSWMDMGCLSALPFGLATLDHFLNASIVIDADIENIFVMTDDMNWVHQQLAKYGISKGIQDGASVSAGSDNQATIRKRPVVIRDKYKLYIYPTRPNHREYTLEAAEDFWTSLRIAQQCSGFVGTVYSYSFLIC